MDTVTVTITSPQSVVNVNIYSGTVTIHNSDNSYYRIAGSGDDVLLNDIKFTDSDGSIHYIPSCTDIVATPCSGATTDKMDMRIINTGALLANVLTPVAHNTGISLGAIDLDLKLLNLNKQPIGFNQFVPDPTNPLNVALIEVGDNNPGGLYLRIIYKKL